MAEPSSRTYSTAVSEQVFTHPVFQHPENRGSLHTQTKTSCILVKKITSDWAFFWLSANVGKVCSLLNDLIQKNSLPPPPHGRVCVVYLAVGDGVENRRNFCRGWDVDNNGVRRGEGVVHHDGEHVVDDHDISLWRTDTLQVMLAVHNKWLFTPFYGFDLISVR